MVARWSRIGLYFLLGVGPAVAAPTSHTVVTATGINASARGNCLIINVRDNSEPDDWDGASCDLEPVGDIGSGYAWFADLIGNAVNTAEIASCGAVDCTLKGYRVRVVLRWGTVPKFDIIYGDKLITASATTSFADSVQSTATTYVNEIMDQHQNPHAVPEYRRWLDELDKAASMQCKPARNAAKQLRQNLAQQVIIAASDFYVFVFAHEIEHVRNGDTCGSTASARSVSAEATCDRLAFDAMTRAGMLLPPFVIAPMITMAHYESALQDLLEGTSADADIGLRKGADWKSRASRLERTWSDYCSGGGSGAICAPGYKAAIEDVMKLISRPLPKGCTP